MLLPGLWERSPIIAVGDLADISELGVQTVDRLPSPIAQSVHTLYWCQASFRAVATVKGRLPNASKYVWASIQPGCTLSYGDQKSYQERVTRVWFLREEQGLLRPTYDGGAAHFYGIYAKWSNDPRPSPQQKLGGLLLTPTAVARSLDEFAKSIWDNADVACSLLGKADCIGRIKALATLGDPALRHAACEYLRAQQGETCGDGERQ